MPVIMMSGHGTIETAVEATRIGAVDFLEKPVALQKLLNTVSKAIKQGFERPVAPVLADQKNEEAMVSPPPAGLRFDLPLREAREEFERLYFEHHIREEHGNVTRIAEKVELERTHLHRKFKQLGIRVGKKDVEDNCQ
jgi:DNA-binding NtrC family response regulator